MIPRPVRNYHSSLQAKLCLIVLSTCAIDAEYLLFLLGVKSGLGGTPTLPQPPPSSETYIVGAGGTALTKITKVELS